MNISRDDNDREEVFGELLQRFEGTIHSYCHLHSDSIAEAHDMMQEVLLTVWLRLDSMKARSSWQQWLWVRRVMRSVASAMHRRPRVPTLPLDAAFGLAEHADSDAELLDELMGALPPAEAALLRRHLDGYSYSEIGNETGLTRDVVDKRLRLAKDHMRQIFEERYGTID